MMWKRTNQALSLLMVFLVVTPTLLIAQQDADELRNAATFYSDNIVNLAPIEAVLKELSVNDDVARKLAALREDYRVAAWKEYDDAGLNPREVRNMTAEQRQKYMEIGHRLNPQFIPKATELLSPDQLERLAQIQFQGRLLGLNAKALLAPEIAARLKLSDDQKQRLNEVWMEYLQRASAPPVGRPRAPGESARSIREDCIAKAVGVLTDEQKMVFETLKGREFDTRQLAAGAPPGRGR